MFSQATPPAMKRRTSLGKAIQLHPDNGVADVGRTGKDRGACEGLFCSRLEKL